MEGQQQQQQLGKRPLEAVDPAAGAAGAASAAASGDSKRPRLEPGSNGAAAAGAGPAAPPRAGLSMEALNKAKKALQLQKDLKEKLKKLPQVRVRARSVRT